jgi:hypothetical protein
VAPAAAAAPPLLGARGGRPAGVGELPVAPAAAAAAAGLPRKLRSYMSSAAGAPPLLMGGDNSGSRQGAEGGRGRGQEGQGRVWHAASTVLRVLLSPVLPTDLS